MDETEYEKINLEKTTVSKAAVEVSKLMREGKCFVLSYVDKNTGKRCGMEHTVYPEEIKTEKDGSQWKRVY